MTEVIFNERTQLLAISISLSAAGRHRRQGFRQFTFVIHKHRYFAAVPILIALQPIT
jgi:hypothetical protein